MTGIELQRPRRFVDAARKWRVLVDGEVVDKIRMGQTRRVELASGPHTIQLRIDWCGSPELHFQLGPGEQLRFIGRPPWPILALFRAVSGRTRYLRLEPHPSEFASRSGSAEPGREEEARK